MASTNPSRTDGPGENVASQRLDSWKEIAAYLKRDVRTVHRWEHTEGLPVHRHAHQKRGSVYAFKAELDHWWNDGHSRLELPAVRRSFWRGRWQLLLMAGTLVAISALLFAFGTAGSRHRLFGARRNIQSLAVLPLINLSGDPNQQYFADGVTEALTTELGKLSGLRVISRTSAMQYKESKKSMPAIARELDVDAAIEGGVLLSGGRVRVTAQLVDARADRHLWAQAYDGEAQDVLALQNNVVQAIANEIEIKIKPQEQARLAAPRRVDPEVYRLYVIGRFFWNQRTEEGQRQAIDYFQRALAIDPDYAPAYAGLGDAHNLLGDWWWSPPRDVYPKAQGSGTAGVTTG